MCSCNYLLTYFDSFYQTKIKEQDIKPLVMRKPEFAVYYILLFIIYKVMKYRKILIKYNAYFQKAVFHSCENIKSCIFTAVKI